MDDRAHEEEPLGDSPSPDGSGPRHGTVAGPPVGTVLRPVGATAARSGLDPAAPDAGPDDAGAGPASEPKFDPPPDSHAATGAYHAPPGGTRPTTPAIPGYEILGELGRGGMGVVYQARQARLNRTVALKMILAGAHAGTEDVARLLAEAKAVARLQHPNIVQIYHIDEHAGLPFFEMELVAGGSLADRLDGIPRPPREAARMLEALASAMAEAHRLGVVHRDLKPGNILLTPEGAPKIADFGLAKLLNVQSDLTRTDSVLGSPSYMAPEQAGGKTKDVGPAADVYSLGAILYELLVGRPPFRGATILETLEQVKTVEPVPPSRLVPRLPRDVETIGLKCLQKDPARRYESAAALAEDLRRYQAGEPIVARPVGPAERAWRWCRRNPAVAGLAAAVAALLVAAAAGAGASGVAALLVVVAAGASAAAVQYRLAARREERLRNAAEDLAGAEARAKEKLEASLYFHSIALAHRELSQDNLTLFDVKVWDARTGLGVFALPAGAETFVVAFSPDGRHLVTGGTSRTVQVWDAQTGDPVGTLGAHDREVRGLAFSRDGRNLASTSSDGALKLWDATRLGEKQAAPRTIRARSGQAAVNLAFSPDGRRLVASGDEHTAKIWDVQTGRELQTLRGHSGDVWATAFSPDPGGQSVASTGEDSTVKLWDSHTGSLVRSFRGHTGLVTSIAFSPDGRLLVSGSRDKTVKVWDLTHLDKKLEQ